MERPSAPRRKSSAGDAEEHESKPKPHRKTFVVGGAAKNHHRVPSYGKKLNQLGKLTALATTEAKPAQDAGPDNSPHRAALHRSSSQKSLTERSSRRTGSTTNLQKLRRSNSQHGSTGRLTALKPMTKAVNQTKDVQAARETDSDAARVAEGTDKSIERTGPISSRRATFVIDDDEEDGDDVASSFANKALLAENIAPVDTRPDQSLLPQMHSILKVAEVRNNDSQSSDNPISSSVKQEHPDMRKIAMLSSPDRLSNVSKGVLYKQSKKAVDPLLSTDTAISKDIHLKDRPVTDQSARSSSVQRTPINSQPLTSRFLESPRKEGAPNSSDRPSSLYTRENDWNMLTNASAAKACVPSLYQSPHASTTSLGIASSRTQQKLLLQRASSIRDIHDSSNEQDMPKNAGLVHPRAQKEIERVSREYTNAKRFRDPHKELASRMNAKNKLVPSAQPLRRTMTQITLSSHATEHKAPKPSRSTANFRSNPPAPIADAVDVTKILADLWTQDDHVVASEE